MLPFHDSAHVVVVTLYFSFSDYLQPCMRYHCLQSSRMPLLHSLLNTQYQHVRDAVTGNASSSYNSYSSIYNSQELKTSVPVASNDKSPPEVPTCCCMSGCVNCVYIQYAVEMADYFKDNGATALKVIDAIKDESIKTFLKMEVENILLKQK